MPKIRPAPNKNMEPGHEQPGEESETLRVQNVDIAPSNTEQDAYSQGDPSEVLKRQLDELRKSEEVQRRRFQEAVRERDAAQRLAEEREVELSRHREEATKSKGDAIQAAIAAAQAEADKAQMDFEAAAEIGDHKAMAEAQRRMARAEANISKMEDGKAALEEAKKETPKSEPRVAKNQVEQILDNSTLPRTAKDWLRDHPEYLTDPRKNAKIQSLHWDVLDEGHEAFSEDYYDSLEEHLGLRRNQPVARHDDDDDDGGEEESAPPPKKGTIVSAPVSRETNANGGNTGRRVRLTAAQREAAKLAGITDEEYGKNLQKLEEAKRQGDYGGRP